MKPSSILAALAIVSLLLTPIVGAHAAISAFLCAALILALVNASEDGNAR